MPLGRRVLYGVVAAFVVLTVFGMSGSPYNRVGPGPAIQVGRPEGGSWSVTTARVQRSNWFQWGKAELAGERVIRDAGSGRGGGHGGGTGPAPVGDAMSTAQTHAALVAAQLAAGRAPVSAAGLQVAAVSGPARGGGLRPGDVLLAAGAGDDLAPLRAPADLETATAGRRTVHVLVVPLMAADTWGRAEVRRIPVGRLAATQTGPTASLTAYPLGPVEGPSAGLVLALARLDALTPGDLTGGRRVAGTGAIGLDGEVTGVGDVPEKVRAAVKARMDVFLVPVWQHSDAVAAARGTGLRVVPVRTVSEAVHHLCATEGRAPLC
ncbi:S16 family serine protease [Actinomadura sp. WMMA1423]|uniref:S16 family serine protease n=1 Tax=Actinomadura sp. WMMA1423 TaxID=2591108 RepID=UPI0011463190|nr:S16 family serine protease [Actinomadura sp. WMMA1423]